MVTGATGAVGGYVLPQAWDRGWRVTGLARAEHEEFVRSLGADFVTEHTAGWDAVADAAVLREQAIALLRDGGIYVGVQPGNAPEEERGITVHVVVATPDGGRLARLLTATTEGKLPARGARHRPLDQAVDAHRAVANGDVRGKYVLSAMSPATERSQEPDLNGSWVPRSYTLPTTEQSLRVAEFDVRRFEGSDNVLYCYGAPRHGG